MGRPSKISYDVFVFTRVKNKVKLSGIETYPLHVRIRAGQKMTYRKSYFFSHLQQKKFQFPGTARSNTITLQNIIRQETEILDFIIAKATTLRTPESILSDYEFYTRDILFELDQQFSEFLVNFFNDNSLPFYSALVTNTANACPGIFLLDNISRTLHQEIFQKLLQLAAHSGPPYIPIQAFHKKIAQGSLPVFPVYFWMKHHKSRLFVNFIKNEFPAYTVERIHNYIDRIIGNVNSPTSSFGKTD